MTTYVSVSNPSFSIDPDNYTMSSDLQIQNMRNGGRFNQSTILTYTDGSEWVVLTNKPKERFCGFLYLQNALEKADLDHKIKAAANKMAIHGKNIIYLSQYCGEKKLESMDLFKDSGPLSILRDQIGFTDATMGTNLRKIEDKIYVFDTERDSFDPSVHEKINSFVHFHDLIRSSLEKRL